MTRSSDGNWEALAADGLQRDLIAHLAPISKIEEKDGGRKDAGMLPFMKKKNEERKGSAVKW